MSMQFQYEGSQKEMTELRFPQVFSWRKPKRSADNLLGSHFHSNVTLPVNQTG